MDPEKSNFNSLILKNILLVNSSVYQLENEIQFLEDKNYSLSTAAENSQALKILDSKQESIDLVLLDPVLPTLEEGMQTAEQIYFDYDIPILFYTDNTDEDTISALESIDHFGVVIISSGLPLLLSAIKRISKAIKKYKDLLPPENPISRLVQKIEESNKINQKSNYGYLTAELVDAVLVDDSEGNIIIANNKACQILGLTLEQIMNNYIYENNWEFIHEDYTPFLLEDHPHIISRKTGETQRNTIMGINRPGHKTQWLSNSSLAIFNSDGKSLAGVATYFYDVTDLITAKKSNVRWARIFEHADWGVAVGEAGSKTIDMMNTAYARMHGYTVNELTGRPVIDVFPPEEKKNIPLHIKMAYKNGHHRFESMHIRKDGTQFPAINDITTIKDLKGNPLFNAVNTLDITERKKDEEKLKTAMRELKKAKEYSDTLFNDSPIAIYSVDKDNRVVNFNKKAEEITGYSRRELIGREFKIFSKYISDSSLIGSEYKIITRNNREKIIEKYSTVLYDTSGEKAGSIESFIDISDWKELQGFKEDIEKIIHHDLKTPLNSIIGFPKLMLTDESISDEYREYLMIILLAGQNMLNLINASLDMYKLEEGTYQYNFENTDIVLILKQTKIILRDILKKKDCSIELLLNNQPVEKDSKIEVNTEKSLLNMILINLIKNAIEASPDNEIITIKLKTGDHLEVSIHNKGMIPEEIRNRFFEKNVTMGKKSGNGLGTYSAKLMANAINADLDFSTGEAEGTTLLLTMKSSSVHNIN